MGLKMSKAGALVVLSSLLLAGCGVSQIPKEKYSSDSMGHFQLHASLVKGGNGYAFDRVSTKQDQLPSSVHVYLNDLSPENIDTTSYSCLDRIFGFWNDEKCPASSDESFRSKSLMLPETFGFQLVTVGIGTVIGVVPIVHESHFDYKDYNQAVQEGLANSQVDRKKLVEKLDEGVKYCNDLANNATESEKAKSNQYSEAVKSYGEFKTGIKFVTNVRDDSGFYDSSVDLLSHVKVESNILSTPPLKVHAFPMDVDSAPADFPREVEAKMKVCKSQYDREKIEVEKAAADYASTLNSETSYVDVKFPEKFDENNFHIAVAGSNKITTGSLDRARTPLDFTIVSKDFFSVYPKFRGDDPTVKVSFDGHALSFENKTKKFVQIKSVSIYYNDNIYSISRNDNESIVELSPEAVSSGYDLVDRVNNVIRAESNYPNMTADLAKKTNFKFGFAIKYRVEEQTVDKTLYRTDRYNL